MSAMLGNSHPNSTGRKWRITTVMAIVFFAQLVVCIYCFLVSDSGRGEIRLQFEEDVFNAGVVRCGTPWQRKFLLRNAGDSAAKIVSVSKSCTCMEASLKVGQVVGPGDSVSVDVVIQSPQEQRRKSDTTVLCEYTGLDAETQKLRGVALIRISLQTGDESMPVSEALLPIPDENIH